MRRDAKVDANQTQLIRDLRKLGCSVQPLHMIGRGCPDLLVGYRGRNYLLEVKDGKAAPSRQKLTNDEAKWHESWRGRVAIVRNIEDWFEQVKGAER